MNRKLKEAGYFFYSQAFTDGIRVTFAILLPALIGSYTGHFDIGLTISLGAMVTSITDAPGPILNKRNGMLFCAGFAFLTAILTAFGQKNTFSMGLEIVAVTFFFSMFVIYGARATAVGNAAILIMILTMDKPIPLNGILPYAGFILAGGLFYMMISLLMYQIRPYRHAQRALGECIREIATYLSIKADFYNSNTDLETDYKSLVAQQIVVNEKQDLVREVFFKTRQIVTEATNESRRLVFTFVETVDLFEDITAAFYDYRSLRKLFGNTGALDVIHSTLKKVVDEINAVGIAIQSNGSFKKSFDYAEEVKQLKAQIDAIPMQDAANKVMLHKIIVNIRTMLQDLDNIEQYFETGIKRKKTNVDHKHFISHQPLDPKIFWNNLNMQSGAFRHAIRVSLACMVGFLVMSLKPYGSHGYWVLLTIAFMLKPAFSLTKQRNIERIIGTLVGGAIGVIVLLLIDNKTALFIIMVLLMIATYSTTRINYLLMVLCMTPYILILFSFLGAEYKFVAGERILDTLVGCVIAFVAGYFLFPAWESHQLNNFMSGIVKANALYLQKIIQALSGQPISTLEYKLARKDVYLNSANLSAAFQRMLSEPKSKQSSQSQVQQFVVLNHILFSNIASIATTLLEREPKAYSPELIHLAKKAYDKLNESRKKFGEELPSLKEMETNESIAAPDDASLKEQLNFIYNVSRDIDKTTTTIA